MEAALTELQQVTAPSDIEIKDAVVFAGRFPSWQNADPEALATFGTAVAALWREIAEESPTPWKQQMAKQAAVLALALGGGSQA
ncbi:hypothetical protein ACEYXF_15460 [Streptomyces asiaticus]|uniref:hypothetical protein n=1 Tax=Streptomyces asiaticus TaxID=114695 RepID=UPI0039BE3F04